jgi:hypothetical protein
MNLLELGHNPISMVLHEEHLCPIVIKYPRVIANFVFKPIIIGVSLFHGAWGWLTTYHSVDYMKVSGSYQVGEPPLKSESAQTLSSS